MSDTHVYVRVGAESYALPVAGVLEVVGPGPLSPLPGAAPYVLGVRNLRGQVVPVFDLAALMGTVGDGPPERTCLASHGPVLGGLGVDEVIDVAELPDGCQESDAALLSGSALVDGRLVGVVDMGGLFSELERRGGR